MSATEALGPLYGLVQPVLITEGITHRQLSQVLRDAAHEAGDILGSLSAGGIGTVVHSAQLTAAQQSLSLMATETWAKVGSITQAGMYAQAQLAADQALDLDMFSGMPPMALQQMAQAIHFEAAQAVESLISRHTSGVQLADRIYANGKVTTKQVGSIIDRALAQQVSHRELAARVKAFYRPDVPGGASYAAQRLARTEINNAHHDTTIRLAQPKPWVLGFRWNLSSSHPRPDPCDDYAHADFGMGEGVYPKDEVPRRPHPQCLCYVTHVQEDDEVFTNKLAKGDYDDYLNERGVRC